MNKRKQSVTIDQAAQLRLLSDNLPCSYLYQYTRTPDGQQKFIYVSSGAFAVHGLTPEQIVADASLLHTQLDPACLPDLSEAESKSLQTLTDFSIELHVRHVNGEWRWLELRSRPRQTDSGEIIWDGMANDVTQSHQDKIMLRKMAERADILLALPQLEENFEEHRFLQEALNRIEQVTGSQIGFLHFINPDQESIELIAWSLNTLTNHCTASADKHYPLSQAGIWADAARSRKPVVINDYAKAEQKCGLPPGHSPLLRLISIPVLEAGEVRMLTGVGNKATDYTELDVETVQLIGNEIWRIVTKRRVEKALRIASQVVNASPVICFRWRAEAGWPVEFVSENIIQWGYTTEEMLAGTPSITDMIHPDDRQRISDETTGYTENGLNTYIQEFRLLTHDQEIIRIESRTIVQRDAAGQAMFYDSVLTDITERHNRQEKITSTLAAQRQLNKRLEEAHNQLLQSEKMASIGLLAAGIAHELNNPIGFVHSNLGTLDGYLRDVMDIMDRYEQCASRLDEEAPERVAVNKIKEERDYHYVRQDIFNLLSESKDGLSRVRKIVQDLKSFSHVGEQEWQEANLHQGIDSTLNIVWNELKYKCTVKKNYADLPPVYCLISQLNQVFMNVLVNAGHAIEKSGEINIRTQLYENNNVLIEICDTGKGIAPEHLDRIFDPFFTTKPVGKGTGLGLSLSYSIIERHHGRIEVSSEVGKGTCFRIIIPIEQATTGEKPTVMENPS